MQAAGYVAGSPNATSASNAAYMDDEVYPMRRPFGKCFSLSIELIRIHV